jgi:hypothetical protein
MMNPFQPSVINASTRKDLAVQALAVVLQHRLMNPRQSKPYSKMFASELIETRKHLIQRRIDCIPRNDRHNTNVQELRESLEARYLNEVGFIDEELRKYLKKKLHHLSVVDALPEAITEDWMVSQVM